MIRVTFELLPGGREDGKRTIGLMEIANVVTRRDGTADYAVILKKTPPFAGALNAAWKRGSLSAEQGIIDRVVTVDEPDLIVGLAEGHHRTRRGIYDLAFRALRACGLEGRNP